MNKAILSYASGEHLGLLQLARPTFEYYGSQHGYDVITAKEGDIDLEGRSAHWAKIRLVADYLEHYEAVLWIDADAMFCDFTRDIAGDLLFDDFHGLVMELFQWRWNPNTGVWLVRNRPISHEFLAEVWERGEVAPYWADQAAIMVALGWEIGPLPRGNRLVNPSRYMRHTGWLGSEWNTLGSQAQHAAHSPRIMHFAGGPASSGPSRAEQMQAVLKQMNAWPPSLPWRVDQPAR